ncbi:PepSY domain-containing protein [Virgibacillus siamensis]|uniref:PepSY domain-containing protein n=1 Tax=Virgibacillus siamensis TaxID=480071 RepID=UPI0009863D59|nr:PepSY domain-containing protein [Virgibacillus siamensis]
MKKKIGVVLSILLGLSALGLGMYHTSASKAAPELSKQQIKQMVHDQYPGKITEFELDKEGNRTVYEVEVMKDGKEYDIVFDGNTGEVLSLEKQLISNNGEDDDRHEENFETENDDADEGDLDAHEDNNKADSNAKAQKDNHDADTKTDNQKDKNNKGTNQQEETTKEPRISTAKAQEIALNEVPGTVLSSELDEDDDRLIYEIEVKSEKKEAEFEIDAYTGEIIVMSIDKFDNDDSADGEDHDNNDENHNESKDNNKQNNNQNHNSQDRGKADQDHPSKNKQK